MQSVLPFLFVAFVLPGTTLALALLKLGLPPSISPYSVADPRESYAFITKACAQAIAKWKTNCDNGRRGEVDFPIMLCGLGAAGRKSEFQDFDNLNELDSNMEFVLRMVSSSVDGEQFAKGSTYIIYPDLKELELSSTEWQGAMYKRTTKTTIEQMADKYATDGYVAPWGTAITKAVSKVTVERSGDSTATLLGDTSFLTDLKGKEPELTFYVQPGNGGPVEDWINVANIEKALEPRSFCVIFNGALDKVRGGYYPPLFFPKLAQTNSDFYDEGLGWEGIFILRKLADKGKFGWLYRVYPEEWCVYEQCVKKVVKGEEVVVEIDDVLKWSGDSRPSYKEAISYLVN